jgi:predicted nucleotidyltransferase
MDRKQIEKIIKIYLNDLTKKIKVEKAVLFGSAARGKISQNSDIDLLILSPSFTNLPDDQRFDILYTARKNEATQSVPMDIFGLTPEEYSQAGVLSIAAEIKENGREIFPSKIS